MSSSVIRQIIRGKINISDSTVKIECTITNPDKVIVLLQDNYMQTYSVALHFEEVTNTYVSITCPRSIIAYYQIIEFM